MHRRLWLYGLLLAWLVTFIGSLAGMVVSDPDVLGYCHMFVPQHHPTKEECLGYRHPDETMYSLSAITHLITWAILLISASVASVVALWRMCRYLYAQTLSSLK